MNVAAALAQVRALAELSRLPAPLAKKARAELRPPTPYVVHGWKPQLFHADGTPARLDFSPAAKLKLQPHHAKLIQRLQREDHPHQSV